MKKFVRYIVVVVLLLASLYGGGHMRKLMLDKQTLREHNAALRVNFERRAVAMKKQGVWEYKTTALGQCLPQE